MDEQPYLTPEEQLAAMRVDLDAHTAVAQALAEQLNKTTIIAMDLAHRVAYYEQHVDSIRYARKKFTAQQNGGNGESRIIQLGS
jgi:hypothetical protein